MCLFYRFNYKCGHTKVVHGADCQRAQLTQQSCAQPEEDTIEPDLKIKDKICPGCAKAQTKRPTVAKGNANEKFSEKFSDKCTAFLRADDSHHDMEKRQTEKQEATFELDM